MENGQLTIENGQGCIMLNELIVTDNKFDKVILMQPAILLPYKSRNAARLMTNCTPDPDLYCFSVYLFYILSMYQLSSFSIFLYLKIVVIVFCNRTKAVSLFTI